MRKTAIASVMEHMYIYGCTHSIRIYRLRESVVVQIDQEEACPVPLAKENQGHKPTDEQRIAFEMFSKAQLSNVWHEQCFPAFSKAEYGFYSVFDKAPPSNIW